MDRYSETSDSGHSEKMNKGQVVLNGISTSHSDSTSVTSEKRTISQKWSLSTRDKLGAGLNCREVALFSCRGGKSPLSLVERLSSFQR